MVTLPALVRGSGSPWKFSTGWPIRAAPKRLTRFPDSLFWGSSLTRARWPSPPRLSFPSLSCLSLSCRSPSPSSRRRRSRPRRRSQPGLRCRSRGVSCVSASGRRKRSSPLWPSPFGRALPLSVSSRSRGARGGARGRRRPGGRCACRVLHAAGGWASLRRRGSLGPVVLLPVLRTARRSRFAVSCCRSS